MIAAPPRSLRNATEAEAAGPAASAVPSAHVRRTPQRPRGGARRWTRAWRSAASRHRSAGVVYPPAMSPRPSLSLLLSLAVASCGGDPNPNESSTTTGGTGEPTTGASEPTAGTTDAPTGGTTGEAHVVPQFGGTFIVIGTAADGLNAVRDLEFNPNAPDQLWTFNMLSHGVVIYFDPGTEQQTSEERIDAYGQHFMAYVSSAAFSDIDTFATCQESRNEWNVGPQDPDDFMG